MADLSFNRTTGELKAFGKTWTAVSGGGSFKPLAKKTYAIPALSLMVGTKKAKGAIQSDIYTQEAFKDPDGLGWYLWIGEAGLGIHPDGNVPGTLGCIGVKGKTTDLFDELRQHSDKPLTLEVTD